MAKLPDYVVYPLLIRRVGTVHQEVNVAGCSSITPHGIKALLHGGATSRSLAELDHSHTRGIAALLNPRVLAFFHACVA